MNSPQNPIKAYTRATHTVAKTRQVVMLYDGAIRFLKQASDAIEKGAIEERYKKLIRVSEIINGLQNSLDFEAGGPTAQVLYDFYASLDMRVMALHRDAKKDTCDAIIRELKEMRDVWDQIDRKEEVPTAAAAAPVAEALAPLAPSSVKVSA